MKEQNSFFSGSMKSDQTDPYVYPANVHLDKNSKLLNVMIDKNIDPFTSTFADIHPGMNYLMRGYIK